MADSAIIQKSVFRKPRGTRPRTGKNLKCQVCGTLHYRKPYAVALAKSRNARIFCSKSCQLATRARVELVCDTCGKSYVRFKSQAGRGKRRFCSKECFNKHGLSTVKCCWPGCDQTMPCRFTRGSARSGADEYKTNLVRKGTYTRFAFCKKHLATLRRYLGDGTRFTLGRSRILSSPDHEYGTRALSAPFTRMLVFENAGRKCQCCARRLDWSAPPKTWEVDHIVPMFKGGATKFSNLQILCAACHGEKSAVEKSEAASQRHTLTRVNRWLTHHQKDVLIERLRSRLRALGAPTD